MFTPLLTAKLRIPPARPRHLPRPHLAELLERGVSGKLTLVSAPAGSGKTALLSEWAWRAARPVAWVTVDRADNDPHRFWAHIMAALEPMLPGLGAGASAADEPVIPLINALMEPGQSFVLILDDYHVLTAPAVHTAISYLLDQLPDRLRLVISGRADPPLPLARLRATTQLTELRAGTLAFTLEETERLVRQTAELALATSHVEHLHARTEGWVVGLQLALMATLGRPDPGRFLEAFTGGHRHILDYVAQEVLRPLPEETRRFLLRTSVLDRFCGSLCDAVTGESGGQLMLTAMEQENVFLVPLDEERRWYRYHHLFAEALRRLLQLEEPELEPELHRRAAGWHESAGLWPEVIGHALAAGERERAAELVGEIGAACLAQGEVRRLSEWLGALPDALVSATPRLAAMRATVLAYSGRTRAAERQLKALAHEDGAQTADPLAPAVEALLAAARGDWPHTLALIQRLRTGPQAEDEPARSAGAYGLWLGASRATGGVPVPLVLGELVATGLTGGLSRLVADGAAGQIHALQGNLHRAAEAYRRAIGGAMEMADGPPAAVGMAMAGLADVLREWNDLESAQELMREGLPLCRRTENPDLLAEAYLAQARLRYSRGDPAGALEALRQAEQTARRQDFPGWRLAEVGAQRALVWTRQGNLVAAAHWLEESGVAETERPGPPELREAERLVYARVLIARRQLDEASGVLEPVLREAEAGNRIRHVIEALKLLSLTSHLAGDDARATTALERALLIAEPEGYVRIFGDEGSTLAGLLAAVAESNQQRRVAGRHAISLGYLKKVLRAAGQSTSSSVLLAGDQIPLDQAGTATEPLSEREVEILRLIHAGLSNQEIAQRLFLTVSTVKWHIHNIYGKLGVRSRTQAVAWARALKVLTP